MKHLLPAVLGGLFLIWVFWEQEPTVRQAIRTTELENQYAHDPGCGGNKACEEESYSWHLQAKRQEAAEDRDKKKLAALAVLAIVGGYYYSRRNK